MRPCKQRSSVLISGIALQDKDLAWTMENVLLKKNKQKIYNMYIDIDFWDFNVLFYDIEMEF